MSPQIALHDPVFRGYFWIVLISLAIGGAILAFLRFVLKKETASMFKTYWSWILIAGLGFIVVFLGRIPTIVGVTLLAICAFKEFALILLIPILGNRARGELQRISLAIIGFVYIGWMFGHLGFLANARNAYGFICYIIFATGLTDVAAFTFGKIFGRHPLRSEIRPNKSE